MNKKDLSIIVPVYNEKNNIVPFIAEIKMQLILLKVTKLYFALILQ